MPLANEVRVSQLDAFRIWRETEGLEMDWLLPRILGTQPETEEMRAGTALHGMFQHFKSRTRRDIGSWRSGEYRFDFNCPCELILPSIKESEFVKMYGDTLVAGRVDGLIGNMVIDYKTTKQFDWDRYMESYQWRFYLDMSDCDVFLYQVFVIQPFGPAKCYSVKDQHQIKQYRYPELHEDCEALVRDYSEMVGAHQELMTRG